MVNNKKVHQLFKKARANMNLLQITYRKKNKRMVRRLIEPYEIKKILAIDDYGGPRKIEYLFGHDVSPNSRRRHIRKWITSSFINIAIVPEKTFKQRY